MTRPELRVFLQEWMCGCGSPEAAVALVRDVLCTFKARSDDSDTLSLFKPGDRHKLEQIWKQHADALQWLLPSDGLYYFVLYVFTEWDLLEHGGSVGGSWLTDKGKDVLEALDREVPDEFKTLCESSCSHGYSIEGGELEHCEECGKLNAPAPLAGAPVVDNDVPPRRVPNDPGKQGEQED